ncbi:MAG: putative deoxyribonuclease YcfH [Verrucomicrobiota bacterium]
MTPPVFYDTHAHLDYSEFTADFTAILERARAAGITKIISIATDLASSRAALALAEQHPMIYAAVGWHPSNAHEAPADIRPELRDLARHPKAVAIGECGLDYYRLPSATGGSADDDARYQQKQAEIFQQQLEVAAELKLNCVIHQRSSFDDLFAQIQPFATRTRGVFHCFGESVARLEQILALGWLVSYTGIVTFKNGQNIRDAVAATPSGKFMLETDCPYLAPVPYRGQRCEPAWVKEIAATVADVRQCSLVDLSHDTCTTAIDFFPKLKN